MTTNVYTTRTMPDGAIWRFKNGTLHREDGPAVEYPNDSSTYSWYKNGKLHRKNGPAIEQSDGTKKWYVNGKLHRKNGPAIESPNGDKQWWINDKLHRVGGPAMEWADGTKAWYLNDERIDVSINILRSKTADEEIYDRYFIYLRVR